MSFSELWLWWPIGAAGGCILALLTLFLVLRKRRANFHRMERLEAERRQALLKIGQKLAEGLKTLFVETLSPSYREKLEIRCGVSSPTNTDGRYSIVLVVSPRFGNRRALEDCALGYLREHSRDFKTGCAAKITLQMNEIK